MTKSQYSTEFKEQVLKECRQIGNAALVARRHDIPDNTVYTWIRKAKKNGSPEPLPEDQEEQLKEAKKRLSEVSKENDELKKLLAEKELELAVLRDLRDQNDPQ